MRRFLLCSLKEHRTRPTIFPVTPVASAQLSVILAGPRRTCQRARAEVEENLIHEAVQRTLFTEQSQDEVLNIFFKHLSVLLTSQQVGASPARPGTELANQTPY